MFAGKAYASLTHRERLRREKKGVIKAKRRKKNKSCFFFHQYV
jgi:hypothetical protein